MLTGTSTLTGLDQYSKGNRTEFYEQGLHVATVIVQSLPHKKNGVRYPGCVWWCTRCTGDHAGSAHEAMVAIEKELDR